MTGFIDRAAQISSTSGTGSPLNVDGVAVSPYQTWAAAGAVNGETYDYVILDPLSPHGPNSWEICHGVYSTAGPQITRITDSSSLGGATPLNLSGTAYISMEPCARSFANLVQPVYVVPRVDLAGLTTYTFSSILQTYSTIELEFYGRTTQATLQPLQTYNVNGLSTAIYNMQRIYAQNTGPVGDQQLVQTSINACGINGTTAFANQRSSHKFTIDDYTSSLVKNGFFQARQSNSASTYNGYLVFSSLVINVLAPITSLTLTTPANPWDTGSYAILRLKA